MKKIVIKNESQKREAMAIINRAPLNGKWSVTFKETSIRNLDQNAKMWAMLADISRQVTWYGQKLSSESWKDIFTAGLKKSKVVPDLEGTGFVVIGQHTSKMTIKEMAELIELMTAFGVEHSVKFSATEADDFIKADTNREGQ